MVKRAVKSSAGGDKFRREELASIHIGKKELGLSQDAYEAIVLIASEKKSTSSGDLDWKGRKRVLERFAELGWKKKPAKKAKPTRRPADDPQSVMLRALWIQLNQAGKVRDPSEGALNAFVKNLTGVDDPRWLAQRQVTVVKKALTSWLARKGGDDVDTAQP